MEDAHAEKWHDEKQTVLRGLVALGGVYFFFMAEKLVALVTEYRSEQQALMEEERKEQEEGVANRLSTVERQRRRASRLYAGKSCEDIITTGLSSKALRSIDNFRNYLDFTDSESEEADEQQDEETEQQEKQAQPQPQQLLQVNQAQPQHLLQVNHAAAEAAGAAAAAAAAAASGSTPPAKRFRRKSHDPPRRRSEDFGAVRRRRASAEGGECGEIRLAVPGESKAKHSHEMPRSLAAVAWMVILGDGLHNFTDGLAIGAAFAQSITGGISTSIAVFCHELPHELGDFAVLLKTGMAVKQALFYNILSSILAAVGMVIGICISNVTSASYWIFAITAGIFIYISLVDMLPELNLVNVKPGESRIAHFLLQNAGIVTGVAVMFLIAMFEDRIKEMFGDEGH